MATHSSILAWRIPGTEEPSGLLSMGVAQSRTRLKRLSSSSSILAQLYRVNSSFIYMFAISIEVELPAYDLIIIYLDIGRKFISKDG